MTKFFRNLTLVLLPVITLLLGWQIGVRYEQQVITQQAEELEWLFAGKTASGGTISDPEKEVDLTLMWSVWRLLTEHYIKPEKLQVTPMLYGATSGLVEAIDDPYTTFMPPQENKEFRQSLDGELQGIGAELTVKDGMITVIAPLKGSPAEAAGLLPEDVILAVDGKDIEGKSLTDAVQLIRGPKGTTVTLTVLHKEGDEAVEILITRDDIKVPSTESEIKETDSGDIGYIAVNRFGDGTSQEVEKALTSFVKDDVIGMIIDVRFNGGGYLDRAVEMCSMFMKQGKVVSVARRQGEPTHHYVNGRPITEDTPLVVLINEGSASASEILAGALQDHGRATVIGKQSFGKGTVQEVFELPGGTSLRVTTARWLTPNGKDLGEEGVHPDIEVDRTIEQMEADEDPQLDAAIEYLTGDNVNEERE